MDPAIFSVGRKCHGPAGYFFAVWDCGWATLVWITENRPGGCVGNPLQGIGGEQIFEKSEVTILYVRFCSVLSVEFDPQLDGFCILCFFE